MFKSLLETDSADYKNIGLIGKVVVNNDSAEPGPKLQRIKVIIPGLYDTPSPWCRPRQLSLFGTGVGYGTFGVPTIGSFVEIELENGDPHYPVYTASLLLDSFQITEAGVNYPNRYGFKDPKGNVFWIDTTTGQVIVKFIHKSGTTFTIDDNGKVHVDSVEDVHINAPDKTIFLTGETLDGNGITGDVDFSGIGGTFKLP